MTGRQADERFTLQVKQSLGALLPALRDRRQERSGTFQRGLKVFRAVTSQVPVTP